MFRHSVIFLLLFLLPASLPAQKFFACFEHETNKRLKLTVAFDKDKKAKYVRYAGQKDAIVLVFSSRSRDKNPDGGIPAYYWSETYLEKYNGKVSGEYTFTNAGRYALDVTYRRKKDGKEFYFVVVESTVSASDNTPFRNNPCF